MNTINEMVGKTNDFLENRNLNSTNRVSNNETESVDNFSSNDVIDPTKTLFPMEHYSQSIEEWLLADPGLNHVPLIDKKQQQRFYSELKARYFSMAPDGVSPWNCYFVQRHLASGEGEKYRNKKIAEFLTEDSLCFGENFRTRGLKWKYTLRNNCETMISPRYCAINRAIVLRETLLRCLPTQDPAYHDPRLAGEGYPFDNLQDSSLKPATPIYIISESRDGEWKYVLSPHELGWVKSHDIAAAEAQFIDEWINLCAKQLATVLHAPVAVRDKHNYYFNALSGTFLPATFSSNCQPQVAIPVSNEAGFATIKYITINEEDFALMPLEMTRNNLAVVLQALAGKPYGWGNYNFNNDCSAELHRLLLPFGILLPRNSAQQIAAANRIVDLSNLSVEERLSYLQAQGKPFTTLLYLPGHIMLYIGNITHQGEKVPLTYQNIWGLRPAGQNSRCIIGGAVFLPLLPSYPENPALVSTVAKAEFKLGFIE